MPDGLNDNVLVLDTATNTVTATIPTGVAPAVVAFAPLVQNPISSLIAQVQALIAAGSLTQHEGNKLINKLASAQTKLDNGQTGAACGQLSAFISQVNDLINNGSLTTGQGQALIDAANGISTSLGC